MTDIHPGQFRLSRIQLVNWGTFHGAVDVPVARQGFLVTGSSGSGKSTLIDAISAVLLPGDRIRFNAAAQTTATRGKGRSLVSYIRGAWRSQEDHASGDIGQVFLRNGATYSIVALTYDNGDGQVYTLVAMFYLRAGATANADISRLYGIIPREVEALEFTEHLKRSVDKRKIKATFTDGTFSEQHKVFASRFRSRLGIANEEAQELLQRAQSAKDLQSLDDLFRGYMLPKPQTFEDADLAVENFRDLEVAFERVEDIRAQIATLEPLVKLNTTKTAAVEKRARFEELSTALPTVRDRIKREAAENDVRAYSVELDQADAAFNDAAHAVKQAEEMRRIAENNLNDKVGSQREQLALRITHAEDALSRTRAAQNDLSSAVTRLGGTPPGTTEEFDVLVQTARIIVNEAPEHLKALQEQSEEYVADRTRVDDRRLKLDAEIKALARSRSNIEARLTDIRTKLIDELGLRARDLVFAGELIDVTDQPWEPVIQRLLGGLGATLLVPIDLLPRVREWINSHDLRALLQVSGIDFNAEHSSKRSLHADALPRKVTVVESPFRGWLAHEISRRFDYRCVDTAEELDLLKDNEHGVTIDGLERLPVLRGDASTRRLSKDDRRRLGDRSTYRLGSTNDLKIESLNNEKRNLDQKHTALVNATSAEDHLEQLKEEAAALLTDPAAEELGRKLREAESRVAKADKTRENVTGARAIAKSNLERAQAELEKLLAKKGIEVRPEITDELTKMLKESTRRVHAGNVDDKTEELREEFENTLRRQNSVISGADNKITETLTTYLQKWPSEQSDMIASPEYVGEGLNRLALLKGDRLAEFKAKFLNLINQMSTQNLGRISSALRNAMRRIQERVEPINESLSRSDFNTGTHLRIDVRDSRGQPVIDFQRDLDTAISDGLGVADEDLAMKRYRAISQIVARLSSQDSADQRWRSLVLDTRRHVRFIGVELDEHDEAVNTYVDSSSLSGGQAQKLVFFCLAAALRFQLAEPGAQYPTYATVILDEAFDRADPAFTRQTMDVFRQFGFHMVLATPLKLIQTLSAYVGGTLVVSYTEEPDTDGHVRGTSHVTRIEMEDK